MARRLKSTDAAPTNQVSQEEVDKAADKIDEALAKDRAAREQEILDKQNAALARTNARAAATTNGTAKHANAEDEGEPVTSTWGEELYSPVQFNTFRVGPFSATTKIRSGETREDALARVNRDLDAIAKVERAKKTKDFLDSLGLLKKAVS